MQISGNIVDIDRKRVFPGTLTIADGRIVQVTEGTAFYDTFLLPGFIDAHIHIESSMLPPAEFARLAVVHGTVATVSDPHEIANVLGIEGVRYMIENGKQVPLKFFFGASPCVPATQFETAGAVLTPEDVRRLFVEDGLLYLSEMMNFPGVLTGDPDVMAKIAIAKELGRVVDGHAPGLRGDAARRYIEAGITSDHECFTLEEALDKLQHGMKITIREGSAAKNFAALHPLIATHPGQVMFCSDDKHPDSLVDSHIDDLVRRAVDLGYDLMEVLRCACITPIEHYGLPLGRLRPGDPADFIRIDSLENLRVMETYIGGVRVAEQGKSLLPRRKSAKVNQFAISTKKPADFVIPAQGTVIRVIEALDGELITPEHIADAKLFAGQTVSDTQRDILKLAVVNRYADAPVGLGFITGFGLKRGAMASSVAHDSHNIIAVGVTDEDICCAVNAVIASKGGVAVVDGEKTALLPLPIAGLMSDADGYEVARQYAELDQLAKELGSTLDAPFMTLSFMALLVIPKLKLSDKGLFDTDRFSFVELYESK